MDRSPARHRNATLRARPAFLARRCNAAGAGRSVPNNEESSRAGERCGIEGGDSPPVCRNTFTRAPIRHDDLERQRVPLEFVMHGYGVAELALMGRKGDRVGIDDLVVAIVDLLPFVVAGTEQSRSGEEMGVLHFRRVLADIGALDLVHVAEETSVDEPLRCVRPKSRVGHRLHERCARVHPLPCSDKRTRGWRRSRGRGRGARCRRRRRRRA